MKNPRCGGCLLILLFLVGAVAWGFLYVGPNDRHLNAVMDCMEDGSRAEYDRCEIVVRDREALLTFDP